MIKCNFKSCRFLSSILALCALMFVMDSIFFGLYLLSDDYVQTNQLWRRSSGVLKYLPLCMPIYAVIAVIIAVLFKDFVVKDDGRVYLTDFLKAGFLIGILIGTIFLGFYIIMPITFQLIAVWFSGSIVFGLLAGLILHFFNNI